MVFCAQCGTPGEGRFCTECGARLSAATTAGASTGHIDPPPYDPYAGESIAGSTSAAIRAAELGGSAFSTGTSTPTTSSGGTSGGSTHPPPPRSNFRGVSGSPIASVTSSGGTSAAVTAAHTGFVAQPAANGPYQQQESPTALFGSQGYRLDAFFHIAREIFVALDRTTQPVGTSMMEASKVRRFRELGGKSIPPFYETHVLPMYYQTIGAQCVGSNVLSWEGWNTFLSHKILSAPDEMFAQLGSVLRGLNLQLPWPLVRTDFPAYAYPDAAARELQFQQGIRNLAGAAIGGRQQYGGGARRSLMSGLIGNSFLFN
ncbi:hypothetical protein B0H19DRAFT_318289 [Mycena capillaripes]|nr:hypothetical protein B0H19DRAFT_318289 [Mycena capillaripes]